jgi:hypothetical protein
MTQELRKLVDRMEESDRLLLPKKDAQELLDRLEKAEKDAGRYRWLRNGPLVDGEICEELYVAVDSPAWPGKWALVGSDLDKAVDAMEASK